MDKIFEKENETYLSQFISKPQIAKLQFDCAKKGMLTILAKIIEHVRKDEFEQIAQYCSNSPAGDCMGCENDFIDFGIIIGYEPMDIMSFVAYLENKQLSMKDGI